jgi:lipoyl(octanoyl) transferase
VDAVAGGAKAGAKALPGIVRILGRQSYLPVWRAMQHFTDARSEDCSDELWVVEHDPLVSWWCIRCWTCAG